MKSLFVMASLVSLLFLAHRLMNGELAGDTLEFAVAKLNEDLPKEIDRGRAMMDRVTLAGKTVTFHYRLMVSSADLRGADIDASIQSTNLSGVCGKWQTRKLFELGGTVELHMSSVERVSLARVTLDRESCERGYLSF